MDPSATGFAASSSEPSIWLQTAAEAATAAILVVDREGRYTYVNAAGEKLLGRQRHEILGRRCDESSLELCGSAAPGSPAAPLAALVVVARTGRPAPQLRCEVRLPDGSTATLDGETIALRDARGAVTGAVATLRDVTLESQRRAVARQVDVNLRTLLSRSLDPALVHRDGRVEWVNPATLALLGFVREDEMVDHDVFEFVHPEEREIVRKRIRAAVDDGLPAPDREERFVGAGGRVVTIEVASLPLLFDGIPSVLVVGHDVTERKRAEAERARMHEEQRGLIEKIGRRAVEWKSVVSSIADGVLLVDEAGRIVTVNHAARTMFGFDGKDVLGIYARDYAEAIGLRDADGQPVPDEMRAWNRALRGEVLHDVEFTFVRRGGSERRYVRLSAAPVRVDGRLLGAVVVTDDITALKQSQAERERLLLEVDMQRNLLDDIVQNAPAGIAVVSGSDFVVDFVNQAFASLAPGIEMRGRRFADVAPEMPEVLPILERVMRTGVAERMENMPLAIQRTLGGPTESGVFTFAIVRIGTPEGPRLALLGIVIETTAQVRARERIVELGELAHRRAAELQGVIETMSEGVFACDSSAQITLANPAALRMLGVSSLSEAQAVFDQGAATTRILAGDGTRLPTSRTPLARALAGEAVELDDEIIADPKRRGRLTVRTNAAAIRNSEGAIVGAVEVAHDVTDLVEFDRLKDEFIRVAAHELKTPVAVMKGYAQAMLRQSDLAPRHRESLAAIDRGANRIDRIVRQLVDLSQLHLGQLELVTAPTDLSTLVDSVVAGFSANTPNHRILVSASAPVMVRADRDAVARVLAELVDNAIRYSPDGGDIDVGVARAGGHATVAIRDHGVGIPRARQHRMFERFFRAHTDSPHDYGGMGVSLYISNEVIHRMGGSMWFESDEGHGSTFHLALPLAENHEEP